MRAMLDRFVHGEELGGGVSPSCRGLPREEVLRDGARAEGCPLRVAHVVLSLDVGGLERNVLNQVRQAARLNQEVEVLCLERRGALADQVEAAGGRVVSLGKRPGVRWEMMGQLRRAFREFRPAVVHTHQLAGMFYGALAARKACVPVIVHTEHGKENYARRWRARWLARWSARQVSRFYCLTEDMAREIRRCRIVNSRKLATIHNGIDGTPFLMRRETSGLRAELGIPAASPIVGTVGRLTEIKRQDLLIRGFSLLRRSVPNAHLLLVGDGPLRGELEALAHKIGVGESVHFAGYQADTAAYLQMMNVFVLTSRSEGLPQAAIEASLSGVPVVASRVGGLPELIDDGRTGVLFQFGNIDQLAAGIREMLAGGEQVERIRSAAKERVESRYGICRMADEYHEYYPNRLGSV